MKRPVQFPTAKTVGLFGLAIFIALVPAWGQSPPPAKFTSVMLQAGSFPAGTAVESLATGDFNGDGKADLLVAGSGNSHGSNCPLGVWLGKGDGTFTAASSFQCTLRNANDGFSANTENLIAVGDFNGDGKLDFAVYVNASGGSGTNYVDVYLGDGTGSFSFSNNYSVGSTGLGGPYNEAVVAGDVNGDGKLDLVAINGDNDNTVTVLVGNGNGTFQAGALYPACNVSGCTVNSVALGDFNGDGHPDLAIGTEGTSLGPGINILLNNGSGKFGTPVYYAGSSSIGLGCCGDSNPDVADADLRGDGKVDVVMTGSAGAWVFLGNGDGTFNTPVNYGVPFADSIAIADINGDGKPDLIVSDIFESSVFVLLGNGNGTFKPAVGYSTDWYPQSLAVADFNGDKKLDFIVGSNDGPFVSVALGNEDGTFRAGETYDVNQPWGQEVTADFNNDGNLDVALIGNISGGPAIHVMLGNSHGVLGAPITVKDSATYAYESFAAGDVNGDGKADIVAVAEMGGGVNDIQVFLGKGNGTFNTPLLYSTGSSANPGPVILADVNGDGKPDVLISNADGSLSVLLNKGAGAFGTASIISNVATASEWLASGDFNADGKMDIVLADSGGNSLNVLLGNGNGTFQSPVKYPVQNGPQFMTVGDLRNNGKLDLITGGYSVGSGNGGSGGVAVLLGNGDGTFGSPTYYNPIAGDQNVNPLSAAVADVNLDGKPDVLVTFNSSHTGSCCPVVTPYNIGLGIFLGNGDGTLTYQAPPPFGTAVPYLVGNGSQGVVAGDFNNDGATDAAVLNIDNSGSGNSVTMLLNTTLPISVSPLAANFGAHKVGAATKATIVVTNNTGASESFAASLSGPDKGDFTFSGCGTQVYGKGQHCTITVTFTPSAGGTRTATLNLTIGGKAYASQLSGTGLALTITPTSLNFGSVTVGQHSSPLPVNIKNNSTSAVSIVSPGITIVGSGAKAYSQTNNCGSSIGAGATCTVNVTFSPKEAGSRSATLEINDSDGESPQKITLTGSGS